MAEYIERDEALRKALDACIKVVGHGISQIDAVDIADAIDSIPAADVVEVWHGEWVHTDLAASWHGKDECSECHYHTADRVDLSVFNYCPHCGAKMDGKGEGDG